MSSTAFPQLRRRLTAVVASGAALVTFAALAGCGPTTPGAEPPASTGASTTPTSEATSAAPSQTPGSSSTSPSTTTPTSPSTSASASPAALLSKGDKGDEVRDLQARLRQIDWLSGTITGVYDEATVEAVTGFQKKRGLPATGVVDQATLDKLAGMTKKPTHDEMYDILKPGPALYKKGSEGAKVKELQARLAQIGWFGEKITGYYGDTTTASVKGFQGKRAIPVTGEVDQRTWDRLVAMTHTPTKEELENKPPAASTGTGKLDPRCLTGRVICISKTTRKVVWVVDGKPLLSMDARFGSEDNITREGVFSVFWKSRNHVSTIYGSAMPYAMFFSGGEAVHYSSDFAARGYAGASHGCVNIRDKAGIAWLFDQVREGDKVVVYW